MMLRRERERERESWESERAIVSKRVARLWSLNWTRERGKWARTRTQERISVILHWSRTAPFLFSFPFLFFLSSYYILFLKFLTFFFISSFSFFFLLSFISSLFFFLFWSFWWFPFFSLSQFPHSVSVSARRSMSPRVVLMIFFFFDVRSCTSMIGHVRPYFRFLVCPSV